MRIEQDIVNFVYDRHSGRRYFFFGKRPPVNLDTELTGGGLKVAFEDAEESLTEYFERWNVNLNGFDILHYFDPEYFGSKEPVRELKPLYVWMLVDSAQAGEWLYD
ncbi:DUF1493 family protein [Pluralibacter gergoviae]